MPRTDEATSVPATQILVDNGHVAELSDGSYFGEITALGVGEQFGHAPGVATATVKANDVTTLQSASGEDFASIVERFPQVAQAILVVARLRMQRSASSASIAAVEIEANRRDSQSWSSMERLTNEDVLAYQNLQTHGTSMRKTGEGRVSALKRRSITGRGMPGLSEGTSIKELLESRQQERAMSRKRRSITQPFRRHSVSC